MLLCHRMHSEKVLLKVCAWLVSFVVLLLLALPAPEARDGGDALKKKTALHVWPRQASCYDLSVFFWLLVGTKLCSKSRHVWSTVRNWYWFELHLFISHLWIFSVFPDIVLNSCRHNAWNEMHFSVWTNQILADWQYTRCLMQVSPMCGKRCRSVRVPAVQCTVWKCVGERERVFATNAKCTMTDWNLGRGLTWQSVELDQGLRTSYMKCITYHTLASSPWYSPDWFTFLILVINWTPGSLHSYTCLISLAARSYSL